VIRRLMIIAAAGLALTACETATPYQPAGAPGAQASGGYSDQQIEANRWRVTFAGNSLTSRETVERYLLFRAAQLTVDQGFDWFEAVDRHTNQQTSFVGDTPYGGWGGYWGPRWGLYRPGFGWGYGYWGDPFWGGPVDVEQVSRFEASAEILMGHGPKPASDPRAFEARAVLSHLGPSIKYPKPS
jgi:hypothetical protein